MKQKKLLSLLLSLSIIVCMFAGFGFTAEAAEAGTTVSNPITMVHGRTYTKNWTHNNYRLNCYNKIVVSSRGVITFGISKPYDYEGEPGSFDLDLYSPDGTLKWQGTTEPMKDSFLDTYVMKIGVSAGTYYMNIEPNFYVYSDSSAIPCTYKYTFSATDYWEVESNNSAAEATKIDLNTTYSGVYCEESYDSNYEDWYRVSLVAGKEYRISIGNYQQLAAGTMIFDLYDPYGNETDVSFYKPSFNGSVAYKDFVAEYSGEYKLRFHNDCNSAPVEYQVRVGLTHYVPVTTMKKENGVWYYTVDGKKTNATTLCKYGNTWIYVKNGKKSLDNTLVNYKGVWYHVKNGTLANDTTLVKYNGTWYYVKNGKMCNDNTLVKYNGTWYHVRNAKMTNETTLVKYGNTWIYVKNGKKSTANTLVKYGNSWYHVNGGKWVKDTTLVKYGNTWYYVKNGIMNNSNTLVNYKGVWYHVKNGKMANDTTLVKYGNSWIYVKNGKKCVTTTLVKYGSKWYYVQKGVVNFKTNTKVKYNGKWYTIRNGVVK